MQDDLGAEVPLWCPGSKTCTVTAAAQVAAVAWVRALAGERPHVGMWPKKKDRENACSFSQKASKMLGTETQSEFTETSLAL